ncbi:hypothetical protein [Chitiniphilus shinanonensis]|uniref:hypothetical protein n=1 Tax=Chitiniphilus shinanonensis TaxID=553088 RepID=UPI0030378000
MGLFSRLFGRRDDPPAADPAPQGDPPELAAAIAALQAEDMPAVLRLATPQLDAANPAVRADAQRLCALAQSRLGDWPAASGHWQALFALEPTAHNALQVATTSVMCGEIERGEQWFRQSGELNASSQDTNPIQAHISFLTALCNVGRHADALPYLGWIRDVYRRLHITDDTFLHLRGVPFLSVFLENSWPVLHAALDAPAIEAWYGELIADLDEDGAQRARHWLATQTASTD